MNEDARFEDGQEAPVNLGAFEPEEVQILSALIQDAVFTGADISWGAKKRRFALLLNRMRWEDQRSAAERVRSVLIIDHVLGVSSRGIDQKGADTVYSSLALTWEPGEDGGGSLVLTLAGDGAIRLTCEALEVGLRDVTRPYVAVSRKRPHHEI